MSPRLRGDNRGLTPLPPAGGGRGSNGSDGGSPSTDFKIRASLVAD